MATRDVTLSDVAAVAGVSLSTASKALSGSTRISLATRNRVEEAAQRLDFRPNALAQAFASGRSRTIGLFAHQAAATFAAPVVIGALRELGRFENASLLYDAGAPDGRWTDAHIRGLRARRVDGVLVIGDGHEHVTRSLTERFTAPVCYANTQSDDSSDAVWLPDNELVGRLATEHLLDRGARRIAHLTGDRGSIAVELRLRGMRDVLEQAGLPMRGKPVIGGWTEAWGFAAAQRVLTEAPGFDAIFCGNDKIAIGAQRALAEAGLRVPDDVLLVGVDNWQRVVLNEPERGISSVDLRLQVLGASAARELIGESPLDGVPIREDKGRRLVAPKLYARATTGVFSDEPEPSTP